jgi:hypothetical protein
VRPYLRALIVLHRTYRTFPAGARVHLLIRFVTCPFLRVLGAIPRDAESLLEIGAGHGLFSVLAADRGVSRVVAVEPDLRKLRPVRSIQLVSGFDTVVAGTFDTVALIDVIYAIPIAEWDALLTRAKERLAPGGVLIVKAMDPEAPIKSRWDRTQEWLSERLLNITMAETFNHEPPAAFVARLEKLGFRDVTAKPIDFAYPHPHVLYVARAGASPE